MLDKIFSIDSFNILSDDKYYYFFRALNLDDVNDIEKSITTKNDEIIKIRTDKERYGEKSKYYKSRRLTLKEAVDHIKNNHRRDTNCISLSTNANVSLLYGRGYYKDKYVVIKVDKKSKKVVNAGLYLLKEVEKRIDKYKTKDDLIKYYLTLIDNVRSKKKLLEIKDLIINFYFKFSNYNDTLVYYDGLSNEQNLIKDKILLKLTVIDKDLIKDISNLELIQAINNACSSLEFIHYNTINKEEIIDISKEMMDVISLIQQLDSNKNLDNIKNEIINSFDKKDLNFIYNDYNIADKYLIDNFYKVTKGKYSFEDTYLVYKNSFYLAKSLLRKNYSVEVIKEITNNKKCYEKIYEELNNTYGVEPEIFSDQNENKLKISENVQLNLLPKEMELVNYISNLSVSELETIITNPFKKLNSILNHLSYVEKINLEKEDYYKDSLLYMVSDNRDKSVKNISFSVINEYEKYKDELTDFEIADRLVNVMSSNKNINISNKLYTKKKEK